MAAAALAGVGLPVLTASAAAAHSSLLSSDPAEGTTLPTVPAEVTLVFNEDVSPQFIDGALTVGAADPAPLTATVQGSDVVLAVPSGAATSGAGLPWKLDYRVVSADGHPISGSVNFQVAAAPATSRTPVPAETSSPTQTGTATPTDTQAEIAAAPENSSSPAASQDDGGGVSTLALATGLAAVVGAIAGVGVVLARRRRDRS